MIDHLSLGVGDLGASAAFYDAALAPLRFTRQLEFEGAIGYGSERPVFWIGRAADDAPVAAPPGLHVAFVATERAAVEAFHAAATRTGGRDAGAPGLRPHYHENYYSAFVLDPDGYKVEAVCHDSG
ncbi:MAG: VOC family protein [Alphaproteobacteria bacterium]|nr:VOC family protein [Alphaproteobacteria bacterium]